MYMGCSPSTPVLKVKEDKYVNMVQENMAIIVMNMHDDSHYEDFYPEFDAIDYAVERLDKDHWVSCKWNDIMSQMHIHKGYMGDLLIDFTLFYKKLVRAW